MRKKSSINPKELTNSYTFESYKELVLDLVSNGKTSGLYQRTDLIHFTELNAKRMKRIEKMTVISEDLKKEISKI